MIRVAVMDVVYSFFGYELETVKQVLGIKKLNVVDVATASRYSKKIVIVNQLPTRVMP